MIKNGYNFLVLVDASFEPTEELFDLLRACDIKHDGTLESIVYVTQKLWLHGENIHTSDDVFTCLKKLKCVDAIGPQRKTYSSGIVLGSYLENIRKRFEYLIEQWKHGVRFNALFFLVGERYLDFEKEPFEKMLEPSDSAYGKKVNVSVHNVPKTETQIAELVYKQAKLPRELQHIPVYFIDAPGHRMSDGTTIRPNTIDNVSSWLETHPNGRALIVSSQPSVVYQEVVFYSHLPQTVEFEMVGPKARDPYSFSRAFEFLARALYHLKNVRK